MNNGKNLAGNDVSIFLFRFELSGNGIHFVLNEAIAVDMYPDVDKKLKPLAHACCETRWVGYERGPLLAFSPSPPPNRT